jgi:hypothetical protein
VTKYFYDTEFIEDGKTIDLISIGIVCEDGREYYAVNAEMPFRRILANRWLMDNVVPALPLPPGGQADYATGWLFDIAHPAVKPKSQIAREVRIFLTGEPELWAWYGAYDHVALAQLWGPMMDLPDGVPMWTNDIRQEVLRLGNPRVPEQPSGQHNALEDARYNFTRYVFLEQIALIRELHPDMKLELEQVGERVKHRMEEDT